MTDLAAKQSYYQTHKEQEDRRITAWRKANADKVKAANRGYAATRCTKLRREFLAVYGGKCRCCGEKESTFLTLEHKNRDGAAHRKQFHNSWGQLADLRRRGWPKDSYEILCFNCNWATYSCGVCPHQENAI